MTILGEEIQIFPKGHYHKGKILRETKTQVETLNSCLFQKKKKLLIEWKFHQYEHRHESSTWSAVGGIWVFPIFIQSPFPSWQQNR